MNNVIKASQIVFSKQNTAELQEKLIKLDDLGNNDVVVKNIVTTISQGTEKANIIGLRVGSSPVSFPRYPGYANCGTVVSIGKDVTKVKVGDIVVPIWGFHSSYNVFNEDKVAKVPDGITPEEASICFI